ncbi:YcdB/YcdC domain-containing protein [Clostridium taeniosporum]|uniref:Peptidase M4 n=1 Tax=Clostridium taeniosporum TaxID=394958 RepID=A0A1D7XJM6_9CLOT|nr:YcdB/YcdC domain-containing protein [Clostridium taeniosporum]AOR23535.1 peptidase M4 [Clostridium taeniosporum]
MKRNYFFTILLFFCLIFNIQSPVFADENYSKSLEHAITRAKEIINIPDTYTDFSHSNKTQNTSLGEVNIFELNWSEVQGKYGNISVSIDDKGNLYNFYKFSNKNISKTLASISKDSARQASKEFIEKALINDYNYLKEIDTYNSPSNNVYKFKYKYYFDDIPLEFSYVSISVDKYTGEVITFNTNNYNSQSTSYPNKDNIISKTEASKLYLNNIGLKLNYYSYYDYKNNKLNIFPAYCLNSNPNIAIEAHSGEKVSINKKDNHLINDYSRYADENLDFSKKLTKEEDDAINNVSGLISKDLAIKTVKKYSDLAAFDDKISTVHIKKNLVSNAYIWTINFENASAEIDAKSNKLLSFYNYSTKKDNSNTISQEDAQNIVNKFLNKVSPNKFKETKLENINTDNNDFFKFKFIRRVNGISFINNYITVSINKFNGKISEYNTQWYDNVKFPDINKVLSPNTIFNGINDKFGLEYALSSDNNITLIYNFMDLEKNYLINPFNGIRLKFTGEEYKKNELPKYSDINGHWCEKIIEKLLENGYYLKGDKFNPDDSITQINFLRYLYSQTYTYDDDDEFYNMLIEKGIINEEEQLPNSLLTNKDISKLVVKYLGYDKIAKNSYIFNNPFNDCIEDDIKGYAAICYSLGIMTGDENKNFNPNNNVTNADAAKIIYNLLTKGNNK